MKENNTIRNYIYAGGYYLSEKNGSEKKEKKTFQGQFARSKIGLILILSWLKNLSELDNLGFTRVCFKAILKVNLY